MTGFIFLQMNEKIWKVQVLLLYALYIELVENMAWF